MKIYTNIFSRNILFVWSLILLNSPDLLSMLFPIKSTLKVTFLLEWSLLIPWKNSECKCKMCFICSSNLKFGAYSSFYIWIFTWLVIDYWLRCQLLVIGHVRINLKISHKCFYLAHFCFQVFIELTGNCYQFTWVNILSENDILSCFEPIFCWH